jgi:hypothetical protein
LARPIPVKPSGAEPSALEEPEVAVAQPNKAEGAARRHPLQHRAPRDQGLERRFGGRIDRQPVPLIPVIVFFHVSWSSSPWF